MKKHPNTVFLLSFHPDQQGEFKMSTTTRKRYGLLNFALDVLLTCVTGGLWLIWIFVREMRRR